MALLYFPVFETMRFADVDALCAGVGMARNQFDRYAAQAVTGLSDVVVAFDITINDPALLMCPAAIIKAGQPVVMGLAMLSAASPSLAAVEGVVADCWRNPVLLGCQVHIETLHIDVDTARQ